MNQPRSNLLRPLAWLLVCLCLVSTTARVSAAERVNFASFQTATASVSNGNYVADFAVDGIVGNFHSFRTGNQPGPYWLELTYPRPVTLASAHFYLGLLITASPTQVPANFRMQYHNGSAWIDVPGSAVTGNTESERAVVFTQPATSNRFRFYGTDSGNRTIRELAFFPPNLVNGVEQGHPLGTDVRLNLAGLRPSVASSAVLNNIYGAGYAKNAFDGYLDNTSRWLCANAAGEYLEVDLLADHRVASAHVYTGFIDPTDPARLTTQPMPNFTLEYHNGTEWLPIPGAVITNNTQVARVVEFTEAVTASRIRLVTTSVFNARVQELLLFPPRTGGTALGREVLNAAPPSRTWDFYSDSYYRLRNRGPDLRLGLINDQIVQIAPSGENVPFIEWQLLLNHRDGSYRVRNPETGLVLALGQIDKAENTPVVAEAYTGLPHQNWLIENDPADATRFRLVNLYSGLVLQSLNTSWLSGAAMVVRPAVEGLANQYWNANYIRHYPKKGVAATNNLISTSSNPYTNDPNLTFIEDFHARLNGSWSYGWGRQTSDTFPYMGTAHTFNPMQWGNFNWLHTNPAGPLERIYRDLQSTAKPVHLMAFNEPDKTNQGNTSVENAIARWPRLEAMHAPLVSPVPAGTFNGWQSDFVAQANALGYRRDYTAVHWYAGPNADSLISHLQQAYNEFGRPIWLTEFSTVNWDGSATWTDADNFNFLAEFMWRAESLAWLKRYSIFAFIKGPTDNPNQGAPDLPNSPRSNTLNADGSLTAFGQLYAGWDGVAGIQTNRAYHLHSHGGYQRARNSGSDNTPSFASPDASVIGVQWFLSPGITNNTYRILSTLDGRPLRFVDGSTVSLGTVGQTGPSVEWRFVADQHGRYFIEHPATSKRLKDNDNGTYGMVALTNNGDLIKWRLVRPAVSERAGPPDRPVGLAAQASVDAITLSWTGVEFATGYEISRANSATGPWTTVAGAVTTNTWADTSAAPDTEYFYRVNATNLYALTSAPSDTVSATLLAPPEAGFTTWSETELASVPAEDRSPTADPDADGMPNLLEYALGLDPLSQAMSPPMRSQVADFKLEMSFIRARADVTYEILASANLLDWTIIATNPGTVSPDEPVTVSDILPVSENSPRFLRLRVSLP